MYLVIRTESGSIRSNESLECFAMIDMVEVSKLLKSGRFKVYKLDALQEVKEMVVTTQEVIA